MVKSIQRAKSDSRRLQAPYLDRNTLGDMDRITLLVSNEGAFDKMVALLPQASRPFDKQRSSSSYLAQMLR